MMSIMSMLNVNVEYLQELVAYLSSPSVVCTLPNVLRGCWWRLECWWRPNTKSSSVTPLL